MMEVLRERSDNTLTWKRRVCSGENGREGAIEGDAFWIWKREERTKNRE